VTGGKTEKICPSNRYLHLVAGSLVDGVERLRYPKNPFNFRIIGIARGKMLRLIHCGSPTPLIWWLVEENAFGSIKPFSNKIQEGTIPVFHGNGALRAIELSPNHRIQLRMQIPDSPAAG
jgi:hypothetical protein